MAVILNIETSGPTCSVALARNGELIGLRETFDDKSHASSLAVFIDELLREQKLSAQELDAVAVSQGPGSYTGLRIGVATAKGIAYGAGIPLIAIDTLLSMTNGYQSTFGADGNTLFCPMIDARRMEVYTACYTATLETVKPVEALVLQEDSLAHEFEGKTLQIFGSGAAKCKGFLQGKTLNIDTNYQISATHMLSLSEAAFRANKFEDVAYYEPFYLKEFVATIPKNKVLGQQQA